ncbi:DNA packaging protein [Pseudogemmobacter sonorensis]|uniref:DNA packaging protein n=1 Tax=Pseudogemmobacter sonorensis TaxID=2989681 RepID=UPI0036C3C9D0
MRILDELALDGARLHRIGGRDLCDLLGLSSGALADLTKRGIAIHLSHDAYDLEGTVRNYCASLRAAAAGRAGADGDGFTLAGQRARLAKAQAEAQEMKNLAQRGELVSAAEVERAWADTLRNLRSQLLAVPGRIRARLGHLTATDTAVIDREIRDALAELGGDDADDS